MNKNLLRIYILAVTLIISVFGKSHSELPYAMSWAGELSWSVMEDADFFWSASAYAPILPLAGLRGYGCYTMRIGERVVHVPVRNNFSFQYRERRILGEIGLDESITARNKIGAYLRCGLGYTFAWYKGSGADGKSGFTPTLQIGILGAFGDYLSGRIRCGYTYAKTVTSRPHGVNISLQIGAPAQ